MQDEIKDGSSTFYATDASAWRQWLETNHASEENVWLIIYNKGKGLPSVNMVEAVEEALCFGWIDSKAMKRDAESRYQFFSRRKPKSIWSKVNKARIERLIAEGKMTPAGLRIIDIAKENGMWTFLDEIEEEIMPSELAAAFEAAPDALAKFQAFPRSTRKQIFYWIISAKAAETKARRVAETVEKAAQNIRAQ